MRQKKETSVPDGRYFHLDFSSSGSDLSRARPGETAVLLPVLPATAVPPLQTAPDSLWTQNPPGGAGVPGSESTTVCYPIPKRFADLIKSLTQIEHIQKNKLKKYIKKIKKNQGTQ